MFGEGPGEYAAACFAGVFDIHQAMALAAFEGRLLEASTPARAGPVPTPAPPAHTQSRTANRRVRALLPHDVVQGADRPLVSNATGAWITSAEADRPGLLGAPTARTRAAVPTASRPCSTLRIRVFVEIGPGAFATSPPAQQPRRRRGRTHVSPPDEPDSDVAFLLTAVGRLWAAGVPIELQTLFPVSGVDGSACRRIRSSGSAAGAIRAREARSPAAAGRRQTARHG